MRVPKNHSCVDPQGLIRSPYLKQWGRNSTLMDLVTEFSNLFGTEPPLLKYKGNPKENPRQPVTPPQSAKPIKVEEIKVAQHMSVEDEMRLALTRKVQDSLKIALNKFSLESEELMKKQSILQQNALRLKQNLEELQQEKSKVELLVDVLKRQTDEMEKMVLESEEIKQMGKEVHISEVLIPADTWSQQ